MTQKKPLSNPFGIQENFDYDQIRKSPFDDDVKTQQQKNKSQSPVRQKDIFELQGKINLQDDKKNLITYQQPQFQSQQQIEFDDNLDPPLLEDLDITDPKLIKKRILSVLLFKPLDEEFLAQPDLSGPFILGISLGVLVMLTGKLHFNYIYGFGISGWLFIYFIMNFMSQDKQKLIDFYKVLSILGYGLAPVVVIALINVFINLKGQLGLIFAFFSIIWATISAAKTFDFALGLENRKLLIAYPIFLFYFTFILISIY